MGSNQEVGGGGGGAGINGFANQKSKIRVSHLERKRTDQSHRIASLKTQRSPRGGQFTVALVCKRTTFSN